MRQYYQEWPDANAERYYPFVDNALLTDTGRAINIPQAYVIDARFWPAGGSRLYLREIERSANGLRLQVNDLDGPQGVAIIAHNHLSQTKVIFFHVEKESAVGWMRFAPGAIANLYDNPTAVYRFTPQATEFVATAVTPISSDGVTAFRTADGTELSGDVTIFGGRGIELSLDGDTLSVNAVGDPYARRDKCPTGSQQYIGALLNPVRSFDVSVNGGVVGTIAQPVAWSLISSAAPSNRLVIDPLNGLPISAEGIVSPGPNGELLKGVV